MEKKNLLHLMSMTKKERYDNVLRYFESNALPAETELQYGSSFELLVAVILSAQCTDKRVNLVTPALFKQFPTPEVMAAAGSDVIFPLIRSISYPNNKAKHLAGMAQMLLDDFKGEVPATVEELVRLPGVGRKTANVIASVVFNQPTMAVDTHVFRVSNRIGLTTSAKNPLQCEKQLVKFIPVELVHKAHHWLILHGRYVCIARAPRCTECQLKNYCKYFEQKNKKQQINSNIKHKPYGKKE